MDNRVKGSNFTATADFSIISKLELPHLAQVTLFDQRVQFGRFNKEACLPKDVWSKRSDGRFKVVTFDFTPGVERPNWRLAPPIFDSFKSGEVLDGGYVTGLEPEEEEWDLLSSLPVAIAKATSLLGHWSPNGTILDRCRRQHGNPDRELRVLKHASKADMLKTQHRLGLVCFRGRFPYMSSPSYSHWSKPNTSMANVVMLPGWSFDAFRLVLGDRPASTISARVIRFHLGDLSLAEAAVKMRSANRLLKEKRLTELFDRVSYAACTEIIRLRDSPPIASRRNRQPGPRGFVYLHGLSGDTPSKVLRASLLSLGISQENDPAWVADVEGTVFIEASVDDTNSLAGKRVVNGNVSATVVPLVTKLAPGRREPLFAAGGVASHHGSASYDPAFNMSKEEESVCALLKNCGIYTQAVAEEELFAPVQRGVGDTGTAGATSGGGARAGNAGVHSALAGDRGRLGGQRAHPSPQPRDGSHRGSSAGKEAGSRRGRSSERGAKEVPSSKSPGSSRSGGRTTRSPGPARTHAPVGSTGALSGVAGAISPTVPVRSGTMGGANLHAGTGGGGGPRVSAAPSSSHVHANPFQALGGGVEVPIGAIPAVIGASARPGAFTGGLSTSTVSQAGAETSFEAAGNPGPLPGVGATLEGRKAAVSTLSGGSSGRTSRSPRKGSHKSPVSGSAGRHMALRTRLAPLAEGLEEGEILDDEEPGPNLVPWEEVEAGVTGIGLVQKEVQNTPAHAALVGVGYESDVSGAPSLGEDVNVLGSGDPTIGRNTGGGFKGVVRDGGSSSERGQVAQIPTALVDGGYGSDSGTDDSALSEEDGGTGRIKESRMVPHHPSPGKGEGDTPLALEGIKFPTSRPEIGLSSVGGAVSLPSHPIFAGASGGPEVVSVSSGPLTPPLVAGGVAPCDVTPSVPTPVSSESPEPRGQEEADGLPGSSPTDTPVVDAASGELVGVVLDRDGSFISPPGVGSNGVPKPGEAPRRKRRKRKSRAKGSGLDPSTLVGMANTLAAWTTPDSSKDSGADVALSSPPVPRPSGEGTDETALLIGPQRQETPTASVPPPIAPSGTTATLTPSNASKRS